MTWLVNPTLTLSLWHWVSDIESLTLTLWHWQTLTWQIGVYQHLWEACWKLSRSPGTPTRCKDKWWWCPYTIQRIISCLQREVTRRATTTPKNVPSNPVRKSKTTTNHTTIPTTASWPVEKTKIISASSIDHILVTQTTQIKPTSDVRVGSIIPTMSSSTSLWPSQDLAGWGRSTTHSGTTQLGISYVILSPTLVTVPGDSEWLRFIPSQLNSSRRALQLPIFGRTAARNPTPHSLVHLNNRRPKCGATSSPAHSVTGGTSPGNQYENAREDCIILFVMWMEDDDPVDSAEKLKRCQVLRDFRKNPNVPQCYEKHVAWITWQYELAIYLRAVDSCLVSTKSGQGDSPLYRIALSASRLYKVS